MTIKLKYSFPDSVPDYVKGLPEGAQRIFVEVFNETLGQTGDEDQARMAGWGAVKNSYEKRGEEWTRKAGDWTLRYFAALGDVPADGKTSVVQVFRTGKFKHPLYGEFTITDKALEAMAANFRARKPLPPTELVVDYEHMSAVAAAVSPAAGWVKGIEAKDHALLATVEWTDKAVEMIRAKEYRFISPEWQMNYRDKESGKDIGPCLLAMALTNRPFIEGMQPVMLSGQLEETALVLSDNMRMAEWDTEYINDLPDKCFAYIASGGEKDGQGKTVPRANRHLPYRKADGSVDLPHLRNALARLDQTSLPPEAKAKAKRELDKAAAEAGVGEAGGEESRKGQEGTLEKQIRELLGLAEGDDLLEAIKALKAQADSAGQAAKDKAQAVQAKDKAEASLAGADAKLLAIEVDKDVSQALADGKLLPKQVDWAKTLRAKDPDGFKSFMATAPKIGPDGAVLGLAAGEEAMKLTDAEVKVGERMGVSKEELIAQKKRDAARK